MPIGDDSGTTFPTITLENPRSITTGLFGGQGGLQNQLEMQGVDASVLYNLTEALSNEDLTEEEIVNILSEMTGLESTVDQGPSIVWQQGDVTDVLGDVQIQIPD